MERVGGTDKQTWTDTGPMHLCFPLDAAGVNNVRRVVVWCLFVAQTPAACPPQCPHNCTNQDECCPAGYYWPDIIGLLSSSFFVLKNIGS